MCVRACAPLPRVHGAGVDQCGMDTHATKICCEDVSGATVGRAQACGEELIVQCSSNAALQAKPCSCSW